MENTKLTPLELQALHTITHSDFYENGRQSIVWDFSVYEICSIAKRSRAGVYSSLVQKGIIAITDKERPYTTDAEGNKIKNIYYDRRDSECNFGTIRITESGYELLDTLELINEYGEFKK